MSLFNGLRLYIKQLARTVEVYTYNLYDEVPNNGLYLFPFS